eukprot:UN28161
MDRILTLQEQLRDNGGDIVLEGDEDYEKHSRNYDPTCPYVPYVVFLPATEEDVADVLSLIKEFDENFSVGTTRFNQSCFTMNLGALINLRNFLDIHVDEENYVLTVGAGYLGSEVLHYMMTNHPSQMIMTLMVSIGNIVGPSLGGGINWFLANRYGTMADNALEYTIVIADGTNLIANHEQNQ